MRSASEPLPVFDDVHVYPGIVPRYLIAMGAVVTQDTIDDGIAHIEALLLSGDYVAGPDPYEGVVSMMGSPSPRRFACRPLYAEGGVFWCRVHGGILHVQDYELDRR